MVLRDESKFDFFRDEGDYGFEMGIPDGIIFKILYNASTRSSISIALGYIFVGHLTVFGDELQLV